MTTAEWQALAKARYLNLESLKRDGTAVRTPLWFAPDADGTFYIYSQAEAYKVKRQRRTPACRVAACDMRGNVSGPWLEARAEILSGDAAALGMALLDRRYWPWKQMLGLLARLRPGAARAVIALRPAGGA
jgi:PPOX class probable F420-dependent enzyme